MISEALYRNPRLLVVILGVIVVAGLAAFQVSPRMEDPVLSKRVAIVTTAFPGAAAEQMESLVTSKLERHLRDIPEIKEILSSSQVGVSTLVLELRDEITDVDRVWSRVRDRLGDASADLPPASLRPMFERLELRAYAAMAAVVWNRDDPPNMALLGRLAQELQRVVQDVDGTELVDLYAAPREELLVEPSAETLATMGMNCGAIAQQIQDSEARGPAGSLRTDQEELLLDAAELWDSTRRVAQIPIQYGFQGATVSLGDIATIRKSVASPDSIALIDGQPAVVVAALADEDVRIDHWAERWRAAVDDFRKSMPEEISVKLIFSQSRYVEQRLEGLLWNLCQSMLAVIVVVLVLMGWRSTIIVSAALPLSAFIVLAGLRVLGIPIHQMSVTGLIIALGLLIDNAIVIVEEVRSRIWAGMSRSQAIIDGVRHLRTPLFGSTFTTTLAFAPIALLPGPPGEFVGSIAVSVILAINASFLLAMTVVPALTAMLQGSTDRRGLFSYGLSSRWVERIYAGSLDAALRWPWAGVLVGVALPAGGFYLLSQLPLQFFPPSNRDQIQIEIELPARATLAQTQATAEAVRRVVLRHPDVQSLHWFLGQSAPTFFYNVVPRRRAAPYYGQALVGLDAAADPLQVVRQLQTNLDDGFANCRVLVRQLDQGPPFDAPIEIRLRGPDLARLQQLGSQLRLIASQTPDVIHTRSDLQETRPKLAVHIDSQESRLAGLSQTDIARQLYASLEGVVGGALLEGSQELPVRVRVAGADDLRIDQLEALVLAAPPRPGPPPRGASGPPEPAAGPPLAALSRLELQAEPAAIPHVNGERMNEVKVYLTADALPSEVMQAFEDRLAAAGFLLPTGYSMDYGGEFAKRSEATGNLLANAVLLFVLMLVTLIVSFGSFRVAAIVALVGGLSIGLGPAALWWFGYPFGFMAIVGSMGLVGVAINDSIVVLAGIRDNPEARKGDVRAIREVVSGCTRHVLATTLTTIAGFIPLILGGGRFWPPLAITIAGGVGGSTLLALYFVPALYTLLMCYWRRAP